MKHTFTFYDEQGNTIRRELECVEIPDNVMRSRTLSATAKLAYGVLEKGRMEGREITVEDLAKAIACDGNAASRALAELNKAGLWTGSGTLPLTP